MKCPAAGLRYLILGVLIVVSACTAALPPTEVPPTETPPTTQIVVEDALGRTVTLDGPPERMVIAGKANFMLNDAIYTFPDAADRVVALTQARQTTAPFLSFLDPGFDGKLLFTVESTAEEIATAQPDLVFLKRMMQESVGNSLEAVGIPVVYLDLETPEQYQRDLAVLGKIFSNPERAEMTQRFYQTRMDRIADGLADLDESRRPSVLVVQYSVKGEEVALEVPPASWIQTRMVELSSGNAIWSEASQGGWTVVNLEQIAAWDPDLIFVISYFENVDDVVARLTTDPNWQGLMAVQQDKVFAFPADFYSWDQPDTRWILGLTWMATRIHPQQFSDIDMGEEIGAFYGELYGLDKATVEAEVLPLLVGDVAP